MKAVLHENIFIEWFEGLVMFGVVDEDETHDTCLKFEKAMYNAV